MNCPNCAAAMDLVESRRYFRCGHCGTFHFPDGGPEADGIRVVGTAAGVFGCAVCKVPMAHAIIDSNHPIQFCAQCRGVLLARTTFTAVISRRRAWATIPPVEPVPLDRSALTRELSCPSCRQRFETYPHYGPGNVVIDNCTRCDLIWMDFGEMKQIVDAPGRDRGGRQVPMNDDDVRTGPAEKEDENHPDQRPTIDPFAILLQVLFGSRRPR